MPKNYRIRKHERNGENGTRLIFCCPLEKWNMRHFIIVQNIIRRTLGQIIKILLLIWRLFLDNFKLLCLILMIEVGLTFVCCSIFHSFCNVDKKCRFSTQTNQNRAYQRPSFLSVEDLFCNLNSKSIVQTSTFECCVPF